jgi:hypothetical protein
MLVPYLNGSGLISNNNQVLLGHMTQNSWLGKWSIFLKIVDTDQMQTDFVSFVYSTSLEATFSSYFYYM